MKGKVFYCSVCWSLHRHFYAHKESIIMCTASPNHIKCKPSIHSKVESTLRVYDLEMYLLLIDGV